MTRQGDDRPGGSGPRPARGDINDHRHRAGAHGLDHFLHRIQSPARGVELQDEHLRAALFGGLDAARKIFLSGRGDGSINGEHQDGVPRGSRLDGLELADHQ